MPVILSLLIYAYGTYLLRKDGYLTTKNGIFIGASLFAGMVLNTFGSIFLMPYLAIQSICDTREKRVYLLLGDMALIGSILCYAQDLWQFIAIPFLYLFMKLFHFGSGDAKLLCIFMFVMQSTMHNALLGLSIILLVGVILSLIHGIVIKKELRSTYAFFPYLWIGYITVMLLKIGGILWLSPVSG